MTITAFPLAWPPGWKRTLASMAHPNRVGGSTERMAELNQARDDALKEIQ